MKTVFKGMTPLPFGLQTSSGALTLLATGTASTSATLDFIGLTGYDSYLFVLSQVLPATDRVILTIRTSTDNGSTYDAGCTDYNYGTVLASTETAGPLENKSTGDNAMQISGSGEQSVGNATSEGVSGAVWLYRPAAVDKAKFTWAITYFEEDGGIVNANGGGSRNTAADVDAIRFLFSSGDIASGVIKCYGIATS